MIGRREDKGGKGFRVRCASWRSRGGGSPRSAVEEQEGEEEWGKEVRGGKAGRGSVEGEGGVEEGRMEWE